MILLLWLQPSAYSVGAIPLWTELCFSGIPLAFHYCSSLQQVLEWRDCWRKIKAEHSCTHSNTAHLNTVHALIKPWLRFLANWAPLTPSNCCRPAEQDPNQHKGKVFGVFSSCIFSQTLGFRIPSQQRQRSKALSHSGHCGLITLRSVTCLSDSHI